MLNTVRIHVVSREGSEKHLNTVFTITLYGVNGVNTPQYKYEYILTYMRRGRAAESTRWQRGYGAQ